MTAAIPLLYINTLSPATSAVRLLLAAGGAGLEPCIGGKRDVEVVFFISFSHFFLIRSNDLEIYFVILQSVRGEIRTNEEAFAIISRIAKSVGNSIGIRSTEIICDRRAV